MLDLLVAIGLGGDRPDLGEFQPPPLEELAALGRAVSEVGEAFDVGGGLPCRTRRMVAEAILQGLAVLNQFASGLGEVKAFELHLRP